MIHVHTHEWLSRCSNDTSAVLYSTPLAYELNDGVVHDVMIWLVMSFISRAKDVFSPWDIIASRLANMRQSCGKV